MSFFHSSNSYFRTGLWLALALFALNLTVSKYASAQSCGVYSSNTSFSWTSPPNVDVLDSNSARWPVNSPIRFAFLGDWCPIPEDITLEDEDGNQIPATVYFYQATQLINKGPEVPQIAHIKPSMSLEVSTDYTLTLSPPNPALAIYQDYQLTFRTARGEFDGDFTTFSGIEDAIVDGNLCEGGGLVFPSVNDPECEIPDYVMMKVSFTPLPNPEVSYLVYRTASRPNGPDAAVDLIDEVERPLVYLSGVSAERATRPIEAKFNVLYAPFPREECFKVVALDEWGRERAGLDTIKCINLAPPSACSDVQFPTPDPFGITPPLEGAPCEAIGIHGARVAAIPPIQEESGGMEEPMESSGGDEGCRQGLGGIDINVIFFVGLLFLLGRWTYRQAIRS